MKVIIANVRCFLCDCVILFSVGQAEGNYYNNKGGGSNYLCLPNDPDNGKPYSYANDDIVKETTVIR